MKLLVATKTGQGRRKNDFCHADEDEIVRFGVECDGETVDGSCGCRRSMCGVNSLKATTTMKCVEMEMTEGQLKEVLFQSLVKGGWVKEKTSAVQKMIDGDADQLIRLGKMFRVGDIVEKRGNIARTRKIMISTPRRLQQ